MFRKLLKLYRQIQRDESAAETFVNEKGNGIFLDGDSRKENNEMSNDDAAASTTIKQRNQKQIQMFSKTRKNQKKLNNTEDEEFVWIPEAVDEAQFEFGGKTMKNDEESLIRRNRKAGAEDVEDGMLNLSRPENAARVVIDIDDSDKIEGEFKKTEFTKRFDYLMDFRADVKGASSVQQALYQNYLK